MRFHPDEAMRSLVNSDTAGSSYYTYNADSYKFDGYPKAFDDPEDFKIGDITDIIYFVRKSFLPQEEHLGVTFGKIIICRMPLMLEVLVTPAWKMNSKNYFVLHCRQTVNVLQIIMKLGKKALKITGLMII